MVPDTTPPMFVIVNVWDELVLPDALSVTVSVAVFDPALCGVITTVIVQVPTRAARTCPLQPSVVTAQSVTGALLVATAALATSITPVTDFAVTTDGCKGQVLAALVGTCTMTVVMTPQSAGSKTATLTVTDSASGSTSSSQTFTITNMGGVVSGTITAMIGGTDATQFGISSNNCTTLGPGLA